MRRDLVRFHTHLLRAHRRRNEELLPLGTEPRRNSGLSAQRLVVIDVVIEQVAIFLALSDEGLKPAKLTMTASKGQTTYP
jgi:hypothetical protein